MSTSIGRIPAKSHPPSVFAPPQYEANPTRSQELTQIVSFTQEFEAWLFGDFGRLVRAGVRGIAAPEELTSSLVPWVDALRELGERAKLALIKPEEAAKLSCLVNHALNQLERCGASAGVMMLDLSPVDDLLVFLQLRQQEKASWRANE